MASQNKKKAKKGEELRLPPDVVEFCCIVAGVLRRIPQGSTVDVEVADQKNEDQRLTQPRGLKKIAMNTYNPEDAISTVPHLGGVPIPFPIEQTRDLMEYLAAALGARRESKMVLITTGLSGNAIEDVMSGLQSLSIGLGLISLHSFPLDKLGEELDQVMPKAGDFEGRTEMLREYLGIKFGQKIMTTRPPKSKVTPVEMGPGGRLGEPEDAAERFSARLSGGSENTIESHPNIQAAPATNSPNAQLSEPSQRFNSTPVSEVNIVQTSTGEATPEFSAFLDFLIPENSLFL